VKIDFHTTFGLHGGLNKYNSTASRRPWFKNRRIQRPP